MASSMEKEYNIRVNFADDDIGGGDDEMGDAGFKMGDTSVREDAIKSLTIDCNDENDLDNSKTRSYRHKYQDRVGTFYSFFSFELGARLHGPGNMQIESVRAETLVVDFVSSHLVHPEGMSSSYGYG